jgi:mRNA interferase RelE/StbE
MGWLPGDIKKRVVVALRKLTLDARPPGARKPAGSKSDWRLRVGDYRVVYEIDDKARRVIVLIVRHRKEVYR